MRANFLKHTFFALALNAAIIPVRLYSQNEVIGDGPRAYRALDAQSALLDQPQDVNSISQDEIVKRSARTHRSYSVKSPAAGGVQFMQESSVVTAGTTTIPTPVFVYQPITNPKIRVAIYDEGYGLTSTDMENMRTLFAGLPAGHLEGLHSIRWSAVRSYAQMSGRDGDITIFSPVNTDPFFRRPYSRLSSLATAVGLHFYQTKLTEAERRQWRSLEYVKNWDEEGAASIFASYYGAFLSRGSDGLVGTFSSQSKAVRVMHLFAAAFFVSPNTPVITEMKIDENGKVASSYGRAYRRATEEGEEIISLGKFNLIMKNGKAISWYERSSAQDHIEYSNGRPIDQAELSYVHSLSPFDVPQVLLDRLPLTK